jgi:ATP-binding cassette subfamily B protein
MAMGFGFIILIDIVILGCASLIMMLSIHPLLTVYALIPFPLIAIVSTRFGHLIHRLFEKVQESFALLTERVRENLSGIRVVKVFVQEQAEIEKFNVLSKDYINKNVRLIRLWGMFFPTIMFLAACGELIVLWFGGRSVISGTITIGSFVAFMAYLQILIWPMIAIGWAINLFQRGAASQARLNRILDVRPAITGGTVSKQIKGFIEFKSVSFTYANKRVPALNRVSFSIEPKQFIGITGPIGSGKTCFVNLLLRLYEPQKGTILVDGQDIKDFSIESLRRNIAYVPQDTFLFSDTVRANIVFGDHTASDRDVEEVTRIAHMYDEIMALPHQFETQIGERGVTLSGGQKQRIALARALIMKRPIIILDDAVSSVDAETEREILSAIKQELKDRTSIVISHRVFALQDAARILVLDHGSIVEHGTHGELLTKGGLYTEIFKIQQLEMKLEGRS